MRSAVPVLEFVQLERLAIQRPPLYGGVSHTRRTEASRARYDSSCARLDSLSRYLHSRRQAMNLTRGLILTLSLALAATVSAQQSITGHDINEAIYVGQRTLVPNDLWNCQDGRTPPNCTLKKITWTNRGMPPLSRPVSNPAPDSDVPEIGHYDQGDDELSQLELAFAKEKVLAEVEAALNEAEAFIDLLVFSGSSSSEAKKRKALLKTHSRTLWASASKTVKSAASLEALELAKKENRLIENRWAVALGTAIVVEELPTLTGYDGMDCAGSSEEYLDPFWSALVTFDFDSQGGAYEYAEHARETTVDKIRKDGYRSYRRTRVIGECIRL